MSIAELSIRYRTVVIAITLAMLGAGIWSYQSMGRLEDPEYTIKQALIITDYPGASASEVAGEVTDEIESAVQRMGQLERVTSRSEPGRSTVTVRIRDRYTSGDLPQIWDELRRRIADAERELPPGASAPIVIDDYGDVYGVFYAVYGDDFSFAELKDHASMLRRELLQVEDVGKVTLYADQQETVFVEFSRERLAELGVPPSALYASLEGRNLAAPAGRVLSGERRVRIDPSGQFAAAEDIGELLILHGDLSGARLYLGDVAEIKRGYRDPPTSLMRFDGRPAIGIGISTVEGGNAVRMGRAVDRRVRELQAQTPVGIEIGLIAHQATAVTEAVRGFLLSLVQALAIVILVLVIAMGLRSGLLAGVVLLLTIAGTFLLMKATGVMLERVSLGALIIALGMLVDNTIVVVEGAQVNLRRGLGRVEAVSRVVRRTSKPLLGATLVAALAFAAIGLSRDTTGEYTRSLFFVVSYSLLLSWVLAVTLTPVLCWWWLGDPKQTDDDPYAGKIYGAYRSLLGVALRYRVATLGGMAVLMLLSFVGFGAVDRSFFPSSTRAQFMVHIWMPQGTAIERTDKVAAEIAREIGGLAGVTEVSEFVGAGAPRFLLTYTPEDPAPAYAMLLVGVEDHRAIDALKAEIRSSIRESHPQVEALPRRFSLGPGQLQKIQVRLRGPESDELQRLASRVRAEFENDPDIIDIRDDWRERTLVLRPDIKEMQARDAGLTRRDIARAMLFHTEGVRVGVIREDGSLLPIIARPPADERKDIAGVRDAQIWSPAAGRRIPMRQVVGDFATETEHTIIHRRNRLPTLTVMADSRTSASRAVDRLAPSLEGIELPPGYTLSWGGEREDSRDAQRALLSRFPLVGVLMVLVVVAMFNAVRPPLIVFATVPLALIGVTLGLLLTGQPFGFMALLGFMSLSGMLIKNSVVLLDELDLQTTDADDRFSSVLDAGVNRMRPVVLAALTTVLGMIPLLGDDFFVSMAVTIMSGLAFATVLTLFVVPVMYALLYRIPRTS
ncbi:MAG: efflux RND transporter permease subunit [Phycisphaerales bacterium]|nr:MAG: efflux RND transporter permease subunit [Phycisphaerales bacterium]